MEIRRIEPDDFCIVERRLRKHVAIGRDKIGQLHPLPIGIASWAQNMSLQVNSIFVVSRNREDVHLIAIANRKAL